MFEFNGDYKDLEQVAEYLPEFEAVLAEIEARGEYRYNDSFKGRIPGIANTEKRGPNVGTHEEAAIYLLQGLERKRRQDEKVAALLADGYREIETVPGTRKYQRVILCPRNRMGGEWREFTDARLVLCDEAGTIGMVLPKGKRSHGELVMGRRVLVLA